MLKKFGIPYWLDRNSNGGGLLLYVREDIPSKFLKVKSDCNSESICVEVNLRKRKWFIYDSYNSNKSFLPNHLECLNRIIDEYSKVCPINQVVFDTVRFLKQNFVTFTYWRSLNLK